MDYIYLIKGGIDYKIGKSKDPQKRFNQLQVGNSEKLELINYFPTSNALIDERALHRTFKMKKTRGEWFALNEADIKYIEKFLYKKEDRITIPVREYNRLSNLKNFNGKSDDIYFSTYIKNLARKESKQYCINKAEFDLLDTRTQFYVNNYNIYSDTHLEALTELLFSEIHKKRIKDNINELYKKDNWASAKIEETMIKNLSAIDERIRALKRNLVK